MAKIWVSWLRVESVFETWIDIVMNININIQLNELSNCSGNLLSFSNCAHFYQIAM